MIYNKWFSLKVFYLRKEKKIFSLFYKELKKFDEKFKNNFDYRFIKEIFLLVLDLYINYKVIRLFFWAYFIIEYFDLEIDIETIILWYYYLISVGFLLLFEIIWTWFYYKLCLYLKLILIIQTYFYIKYLLWCLFFHPHLYAITFGIIIGFVVSHGIFIKFYKIPFRYQKKWSFNLEKSLKQRKILDTLLYKSNKKWQQNWFENSMQLWAYRNNYKILKKDYETLNKLYVKTVVELNRAKRQIVKNKHDNFD